MRFLLYPFYRNLENFKQQRDGDNAALILFVYPMYSPCCTPRYIRQRGVFVSQFISTMAFADASYTMSVTSLYAFLVWYSQAQNLLMLISGDLQALKL